MTETEKQDVEQAHAQNLQDEAKRLKAEAERKAKEKREKDSARKRAWRNAKKAAIAGAKAVRAKPAKQTAKAKPAKGRKSRLDQAAKISLLVKENPKRRNTIGFRLFEKYRNGMTVADYMAKGGRMAYLRWDIERKFIKVG